ncbi:UNVERIFIED_CONTAM: hypothetical protein Scaly_3006800 [Sesamum calycinum]|uniref:Retrotransposon gag domain-containing protein n=1 Tax=Sesamum calycinum TaxID=2727403 RepID=A0AAW2KD48_9LAMI
MASVSVGGYSVVVLLSGGSSRLLRTANHTVPLPPHCGRAREKWYQSLNATMGPRRVAVTQANSAARMPSQDAKSPRHAGSPSKRAANREDENSRLTDLVMNLEEKVSSLETEITVLNSELRNVNRWSKKWPVPLEAYGGARDAKEVENFLFDMEQYFLAANVEDEARKVSTATMYLTGDAKLCWCTKYAEIQANQVRLDTWALLREAIREQFFPENVEYNARRALRKWSIQAPWGYVKTFSALMLDIRDMSEKDKLFTFMEGLKLWVRLELQRQR